MTIERWANLIFHPTGNECKITYVPKKVIHNSPFLKFYAPPLYWSIPYVPDLSKAKLDFGFRSTPVEEWINTTVQWYRDQYSGEDSDKYEHR